MSERKTKRMRLVDDRGLLSAGAMSAMFHGFELAAYQGVLSVSPDHAGALMALGHLYTKLGCHKDALEIDKRLVVLCPDDPICRYNYACSLSNLSRVDESLAELDKSVKLGYRDFAYMKQDPDLANARKDPRFKQFTETWKRERV
jgi:tetratricopeptide (TPR) repeat protein